MLGVNLLMLKTGLPDFGVMLAAYKLAMKPINLSAGLHDFDGCFCVVKADQPGRQHDCVHCGVPPVLLTITRIIAPGAPVSRPIHFQIPQEK